MSRSTDADPIAAFVEAASRFCALIETADAETRGGFVWQAGERLAELYAAASALPLNAPTDAEGPQTDTDVEASVALAHGLREKLGDLDRYRRLFDPYDEKDAPFDGSLAHDLAEVYSDVKEGLAAHSTDAPRVDVVWDWHDAFAHHWGIHASAALYAIHWFTHTSGEKWISPDEA